MHPHPTHPLSPQPRLFLFPLSFFVATFPPVLFLSSFRFFLHFVLPHLFRKRVLGDFGADRAEARDRAASARAAALAKAAAEPKASEQPPPAPELSASVIQPHDNPTETAALAKKNLK